MKLLFTFLVAMLVLVHGDASNIEFRKFAETDNTNHFATVKLASYDDDAPATLGCEIGSVESKYCDTEEAQDCFGRHGQAVPVKFEKPFPEIPKVIISLTMLDTHKDRNVRIRVLAQKVTKEGFEAVFRPWDDSVIFQLGVSWMACPSR
ncbi:uncharacterized protein LOC114534853 [Dendronephthya gigantea]|uniref:uncharacterized protein LOC114534853 n=1 Tax=Dendronephthya gigantea TaxID=151771 RepID=UPI00106D313A|nr:uncharacterized protein LOC114534853 [Dendronephthya gigantea]